MTRTNVHANGRAGRIHQANRNEAFVCTLIFLFYVGNARPHWTQLAGAGPLRSGRRSCQQRMAIESHFSTHPRLELHANTIPQKHGSATAMLRLSDKNRISRKPGLHHVDETSHRSVELCNVQRGPTLCRDGGEGWCQDELGPVPINHSLDRVS